uniref:hypothetical protein n=1 Tax=Algoriphagus sp. TaxID=1872435 RepID=UPI004048B915
MFFYSICRAGTKSGFGHVYRQYALSDFFEITKDVKLLILLDELDNCIDDKLIKFQEFECFTNEIELFNYIKRNSIVFVDYYDCNVDLLNSVSILKVWHVIVCSDINFSIPNCEILINHLPNIDISQYSSAKVNKYFLGPEYAILRKAFYAKPQKNHSNRFFICLGGSGVKLELDLILNALLSINIRLEEIDIVTTEKLSNINFNNYYYNLNDYEMRELIASSSICFITPGNISYEVFSVNRKAIIGSLTPEQMEVAIKFQNLGLCVSVGNWRNADFSKLSSWIDQSEDTQKSQNVFFNNNKLSDVKKEFLKLCSN